MRPTRGKGNVYLRENTWWIRYSKNGHEFRESAKTNDEREAWRKIDERLKQKDKPTFVDPSKEKKLTLEDLERKILSDYKKHDRRSEDTVVHCLKRLKTHFAFDRLVELSTDSVERYIEKRFEDKAQRSTINRELAYLRRGFRLLMNARPPQISSMPSITLLDGENVREGFIEKADFDNLLEQLLEADRDIVSFLYHSAWRSKEAMTLEWKDVDLNGSMIRLRSKNSKNKKPRLLPMRGELQEIIERRAKARLLTCPFVFHRNGQPIHSFRKAFQTAAEEIGHPNLTPHDMRRSAIRNFRKAGLSQDEAMKLSGHKTVSVFQRYDIVDEQDLEESMDRVEEYLRSQKGGRKVVSMRRAK